MTVTSLVESVPSDSFNPVFFINTPSAPDVVKVPPSLDKCVHTPAFHPITSFPAQVVELFPPPKVPFTSADKTDAPSDSYAAAISFTAVTLVLKSNLSAIFYSFILFVVVHY